MLETIQLIVISIKLILRYQKAILTILLTFITLLIVLGWWGSKLDSDSKSRDLINWHSIKKGDSIFVKKHVFYLDFFKKGREKLESYEQREIKYRREDTLNFIKQNSLHEKYFFQNRTSFVGICINKDSTITKQGVSNSHRWIKIKPSYEISHPPKTSNFIHDTRKWHDDINDYFVIGRLSKDFFVSFNDITNTNNNLYYSN
jgi:hypothetical protein